jgi:anti-sigma factor RsiW
MTQTHCSLTSDREETLIAYVYDDIDPAVRATFVDHLRTCDRCKADLRNLGDVRRQLARWSPPEPNFGRAAAATVLPARGRRSRATLSSLQELPAWAQVAAALLFLGVSAGIANLDVRYDQNGVTVRTGWSRPANPAVANAVATGTRNEVSAPWRGDLAALERQLRAEMRPVQPVAGPPRPAPSEAEIIRRVRTLVDESERRQQNELALRFAEMSAELSARRQAEMTRIGRSLRNTENKLGAVGAEVLKTRTSLNYFMNVNQRQ